MEATLAKVDKLDLLMNKIVGMMEGTQATAQTPPAAATPDLPLAPPAIVRVPTPQQTAPITRPDDTPATGPLTATSDATPGDVRPLTYEGMPPHPRAPHEIRQSPVDPANAGISMTDVGQVG
jgi:hypothetical protein